MLFTFPSRYLFTIGRQEYLALEGGPPSFPRDYTCPAVLENKPACDALFAYGALTLSRRGLHHVRLSGRISVQIPVHLLVRLTTPSRQRHRP